MKPQQVSPMFCVHLVGGEGLKSLRRVCDTLKNSRAAAADAQVSVSVEGVTIATGGSSHSMLRMALGDQGAVRPPQKVCGPHAFRGPGGTWCCGSLGWEEQWGRGWGAVRLPSAATGRSAGVCPWRRKGDKKRRKERLALVAHHHCSWHMGRYFDQRNPSSFGELTSGV